jgi:hypothetical protein
MVIAVRYARLPGQVFVWELAMQAASVHESFRGVSCRYCGKPVRLSATFLKRESKIKETEPSSTQELHSKVFPARCRRCHGEAIYSLSQIADFPAGVSHHPVARR